MHHHTLSFPSPSPLSISPEQRLCAYLRTCMQNIPTYPSTSTSQYQPHLPTPHVSEPPFPRVTRSLRSPYQARNLSFHQTSSELLKLLKSLQEPKLSQAKPATSSDHPYRVHGYGWKDGQVPSRTVTNGPNRERKKKRVTADQLMRWDKMRQRKEGR